MNFNGGKKPMYIFGVDIDKFCEDIKLFKNLPEFCDNLVPKTERIHSRIIESYDKINEETNINNRNKKKLTKIKICKIVERLSKIKTKKKDTSKLRLSHFFRNNNLSDILPSLSFSTKTSNNNNPNSVIKKVKKKSSFRNIFNRSSQDKKMFDTSYLNNLNNSKIFQEKKNNKNTNEEKYIKKWDLPKIFKFDLTTGREKEKPKNPYKFRYLEIPKKIYSPNYDYIYSYNSYNFVNYSPDYKKNFNKVKSSLTRKAICNSEMMRNGSSDRLYLIDVINNEKKKKLELRNIKIKEKYGELFEYLNFDKNKHKLKMSILDKNIEDL